MNNKTKKITVAAMLVALSVIFVLIMPKIDIGIWSFTPFSHIFIMLGSFIAPYVGIFASIGALTGFLMTTGNPVVWLRAGSHIFFVLAMVLLLKKFPPKNKKNLIFVGVITAIVHTVFEIIAVYFALEMAIVSIEALKIPGEYSLHGYVFLVVGGGTFAHSLIDFFAAFGVLKLLKKAHVVNEDTLETPPNSK